jgi:hypothetical protein
MVEEESTSTEEETSDQTESTQETDKTGALDFDALTEEQLAKLLDSEKGRVALQTEADKRQSSFEKRVARENRARQAQLSSQRENEATQRLIDSGDMEELGTQTAERVQERTALVKAAAQVSNEMERMLLERPEFRILGEDTMAEAYEKVKASGGNVVDLTMELTNRLVAKQGEVLGDSISERVDKEMDARLVSAGLQKRSEDGGVTEDTTGGSVQSGNLSEDDILQKYGDGDDSLREQATEILRSRDVQGLPPKSTK